MTTPIKTKQTFGSLDIAGIKPALPEGTPKAINLVISFEEALKLHLSLGQALGKLNSYNRSTTAGKRSAINLCMYTQKKRISVNEAKLPTMNETNTAPADLHHRGGQR